ncbi:prolyl oligopeptidase family serine peptidase [Hyphococcus flavus]|uniref:prolyl oligopeptidase n=1 Tax=Hyphococcus flavus TaxID=1866326 RepID=A0AAE9ZCQ3_9PROT|nr:prolyl oligopeptidase family serine peptidase [Hyphococcus flavus]WDI30562.1 prolyl oligopeptidase family serine peptidase [Hyphococcus flavus]
MNISYPKTRTSNQVDYLFGERVADPYRWLEGDVRESKDVAAWVQAQNDISGGYLNALTYRSEIKARLGMLWNYEKFTLPTKRGERCFFMHNTGLQSQFVLVVQEGERQPRMLLDPNSWSEDGATALAAYFPSPDGKFVAYQVQDGGSDWRTIKIVSVDTGEALSDRIDWVKFSGLSWKKDGSGFFYSRYPEPETGEAFQSLNHNQAVYFHAIGDDQPQDRLIYARAENPEHGFGAEVSSDGETLVITVWRGTDERYEVVLIDLSTLGAAPVELISGFESNYTYIATANNRHFFLTDSNAPRGRVVSTPVDDTVADWLEVIPESENVISGVSIVGGRLFATYMQDVKSAVLTFDLDGALIGDVTLPGVGTASGFGGEPEDTETFFGFESFNQPYTLYRFDVGTGDQKVFKQPDAPFNPDGFVVRQVFYPSKDGTEIPMFIAHRKDLDLSSAKPALLYGYGGFNVPLTPAFSVTRLQWMEMGGVYAVANIRGGGEYGKAWHDAGRLRNKQNAFDDFIAAGEYLIEKGVTSKDRLSIFGGSNGGLLVGAVVNQRPGLFAAAIPAVGVMDMLRFHKFTAGRFWTDDYGDPDEKEHFRNLYAYSPYHNINEGEDYPAVLITTADTDDRVVPGHSFKYAAALQAADIGDKPHLIRIETRAGHGAGKPTEKIIEEYADMWAFLAHHTELEPHLP